jgi:hypothetical protein
MVWVLSVVGLTLGVFAAGGLAWLVDTTPTPPRAVVVEEAPPVTRWTCIQADLYGKAAEDQLVHEAVEADHDVEAYTPEIRTHDPAGYAAALRRQTRANARFSAVMQLRGSCMERERQDVRDWADRQTGGPR